MIFLKQSTASQEVMLGPFVDSTDGVTPENALTIANTDIKIFKAGATTLANKNSGGATYVTSSNGLYSAALDATDTNTLGSGCIHVYVTGALPFKQDFVIWPANVYDALILGTDVLTADVTQWSGTNVATPDTAGFPKVTIKNGTGTGELSITAGSVKTQSGLKKNQALANFPFLMTDSTNHNPLTGLTVSATRSIDGAAFGAGTIANMTEVANGIYQCDLGAGDLNGDTIVLRFTASGADDLFVTLITEP
jgi:hypothetical protein